MKVLSIIVPSYNSEAYINRCIESLLVGDDGIEIIIVNDGSTDRTADIANTYARDYPDIIRTIHQGNSGHGGAVNTGICAARGHFIKIVDSDDWVNPSVLNKLVNILGNMITHGVKLDMLISDFIYDKVGQKNKKTMSYENIFPTECVFSWKDMKRFSSGKYLLMHSIIYSKEILLKSGLKLPEHTFYVDNIYAYVPLPYVEKLYYLNECFYHYYIGRNDQSVNEENMIKRIEQQVRVNQLMIDVVDIDSLSEKKLKKYMIHYLNIVTVVSSIFLLKKGTRTSLEIKKALWRSIKNYDTKVYSKMRRSVTGSIVHIPGQTGRKVTLFAYKKAQQLIGFN